MGVIMSYRKYMNDYRIEQYVDDKGRTKSMAVYVGGDFILAPAISVRDKRLVPAMSVVAWIALLGALFPLTGAEHMFYIMLPFIFSTLPLFLLTGPAFLLAFEKEPMTRERADKIAGRLPRCSILTALLSGAACLGLVITAVLDRSSMLFGDILFGVLSLVVAAAALLIFIKCRELKARKVG